jgi:hypothetical protein
MAYTFGIESQFANRKGTSGGVSELKQLTSGRQGFEDGAHGRNFFLRGQVADGHARDDRLHGSYRFVGQDMASVYSVATLDANSRKAILQILDQ